MAKIIDVIIRHMDQGRDFDNVPLQSIPQQSIAIGGIVLKSIFRGVVTGGIIGAAVGATAGYPPDRTAQFGALVGGLIDSNQTAYKILGRVTDGLFKPTTQAL